MKKIRRQPKVIPGFSNVHSTDVLRATLLPQHHAGSHWVSRSIIKIFWVLVIFFASTPPSSGEEVAGKIHIFTGTYLPTPFIKSKLGFARAVSHERLPESIRFTSLAMPRAFCSEIDFDDVEDRNFALEPNPFENKNFNSPQPNPWFKQLIDELTSRDIKQYFQLIGAPKPFQQKVIERPAIHPTPTNISESAKLTAAWTKPALMANPAINWVIWNEPSHTLRGKPTPAAAEDMADIYRSYYREINPISPYDSFGLAGFITASVNMRKSGSFMNAVLNKIGRERNNEYSPPIDFISLNSYYGKIDKLLNATNHELALINKNIPIVITQYAPDAITQGRIAPGSIQAAIQYIEDLDKFVQDNTVQHVCMSYFVGGKKAFILSNNERPLIPQPTLLALGLYQKLPVWRLSTQVDKNIKTKILSGRDNHTISVLLYNTSEQKESVTISFDGLSKDVKLNKEVTVESVSSDGGGGIEKNINLTQSNEIILNVESDKIIFITAKISQAAPVDPTQKIGKFISSKMFVNRNEQNVTNENRFGYYDQIDQAFALGTESSSDVAIAEATYLTSISNLEFTWKPPPGVVSKDMQSCSFIIIQSHDGNSTIAKGYGNKDVLSRAEAVIRKKLYSVEPLSFKKINNDYFSAQISTPHSRLKQIEQKKYDLSFYVGLAGCAKPTKNFVTVSTVNNN